MQTLVLVQRFRGSMTDVGPGLLVLELAAEGPPITVGTAAAPEHGARQGTAIAVLVVSEEER